MRTMNEFASLQFLASSNYSQSILKLTGTDLSISSKFPRRFPIFSCDSESASMPALACSTCCIHELFVRISTLNWTPKPAQHPSIDKDASFCYPTTADWGCLHSGYINLVYICGKHPSIVRKLNTDKYLCHILTLKKLRFTCDMTLLLSWASLCCKDNTNQHNK